MIPTNSSIVKFVGLDQYRAAGGTVREDLFGEENFLEKPAWWKNSPPRK